MRVLVTGGAGFIGSNLCRALAPLHEVMSIDNYSSGSVENHVDGVTYLRMDTNDIDTLDFEPELIYHLGEFSRVEKSFDAFDLVWQSNINGTRKVLEFVRKTGAKLIYAGSSTKFGDIGSNSSPYAWAKATNTQLVKNYAEWFGIKYAITYFYNVYGPGEIATGSYATVIAKFAHLAKEGKTLEVTAPGTQIRNFTHIDDTVRALLLIGEHGVGDEYGIASDEAYSILEIAKCFSDNVVLTSPQKGNRMSADVISDKTKWLGWSATRNVRDYIHSLRG